ARSKGRPADGKESALERRPIAEAAQYAGFPRICGEDSKTWNCQDGEHANPRNVSSRRNEAKSRFAQLPRVWPGRDRIKPSAGFIRSNPETMGGRSRTGRRRFEPQWPRV